MLRARNWLLALVALVAVAGTAAAQRDDEGGVVVRRPSFMRILVPAKWLERSAENQYVQLKRQATSKHVLLPEGDARVERVRRISRELLPFTLKWNPRAKEWQWDVVVIKSPTVNAFCMPGGKIAFFTGILDTLALTDDEAAIVMGHEMAHALREHARARSAKSTLTQASAAVIGMMFGSNYGDVAGQAGGLLTLKFNRDDERDADLVGLELAARAGYNPEAGISLWEKMAKVQRGAPPIWLSTHPSGADRIARIRKALPLVMPLYEKARARRANASGATQAPEGARANP